MIAVKHSIVNKMFDQTEFQILLLLARAWAEKQERVILLAGVPLSPAQFADAQEIGVIQPDKVRLLKVSAIPVPKNPVLRATARTTHLLTPQTAGLTLRYGIFIRADGWENRRLVFHELVHMMQYERLGGIHEFLQQYLHECLTLGYPAAPMEQEAIFTTARLCG